MAGVSGRSPALVVLGDGSLAAARRVRSALAGALIHGLCGRVAGADAVFGDFGGTLRQLFRDDVPIVAFCAAGIVIRALAPVLRDKRAEPPVLAVAEDGSAVVPLLGGLRGVNTLARVVAEVLNTAPAITASGEVRFAAGFENPPEGYELRNPGDAKRFMADLLAGERVRLSGDAPWLADTRLPFDRHGNLSITVAPYDREPADRELMYHPRSVAAAVVAGRPICRSWSRMPSVGWGCRHTRSLQSLPRSTTPRNPRFTPPPPPSADRCGFSRPHRRPPGTAS